jgi:hypothetical protein
MKKDITFEDLETLLNSLTKKTNFIYNGVNHGAMVANDGKVIVKNFKTGVTVGKKQFLSQFFTNSYTPKIEIEEDNTTTKIKSEDYQACFVTPPILSIEFIEYLQIQQFKEEYEKHPNIGLFDFDKLRELYPTLKVRNRKNVLFSKAGEIYNISVKWDSSKAWRSVKGTKANIGAFLKANKPTSTLILTEGLKDAINANIAFPMADILSTNGKSNSYNFRAWNINLKDYKYIIFANDRDALEDMIKMFPIEYKEHFKKTRFINWDLVEHGKDLTDIIEKTPIPKMTKRDRIRKSLPILKKLLHKESFYKKYVEVRAKEGEESLKRAIESDNKSMAMRAIKTINMFGGDMTEGVKYYLTKQNETKGESINISLGADNRLSTHTQKIIDTLSKSIRVFLNAPTGTGKSYTSLVELPKHYKNIIIISPLRMVTNEHGAKSTPYTNIRFDDNLGAIQADLNSSYIAVTTDIFSKLYNRFKSEFVDRLNRADLIIFDEQHLYYDSLGFRDETVVKCYEYLLYKHEGKTLFMSGTPIVPNDIKSSLITAKVLEQNKELIKFFYNPFENTEEIIQSIRESITKGSTLIYVNSRTKVKELQNLLSDIDTLGITSYEYIHNGTKTDESILNEDLGNIVYISTTKATTGVNFKHLKTIYQYGTPYTPNTFIQLMARLRSGGNYFVINPKFKRQKEQYNAKRAIGLSLAFQRMGIEKVGNSFYSDEFQKWLKNFVLLSHNNKNLQGFYKTYKKAFQLIEAKGLGKFNEDNSDFGFIGHNVKNIQELFNFDDENEFRKYIEQIIIDWTIENSVELLNNLYNLSFKIVNATYQKSEESHHLITQEDKEQKKEERKEVRDEIKELYESINEKFQEIGITAKYLKKYGFSDTELSKLNDIKIHIGKVKTIEHQKDKATALKFYLIPKSAIFKVANELIIEKDYLTVRELDEALQKIFITNARGKYPYEKLLIETFNNDFFNDSYLVFKKEKRVKKKKYINVLEISREHKKHFKELRTKRAKERFLKEQLRLQDERESQRLTKEYGYEVIVETVETTQNAPTKEELQAIIDNENLPIDTRAKAMHQLSKLKQEVA